MSESGESLRVSETEGERIFLEPGDRFRVQIGRNRVIECLAPSVRVEQRLTDLMRKLASREVQTIEQQADITDEAYRLLEHLVADYDEDKHLPLFNRRLVFDLCGECMLACSIGVDAKKNYVSPQ